MRRHTDGRFALEAAAREHEIHMKRLRAVKGVTDAKPPREFPHVREKAKKKQIEGGAWPPAGPLPVWALFHLNSCCTRDECERDVTGVAGSSNSQQ